MSILCRILLRLSKKVLKQLATMEPNSKTSQEYLAITTDYQTIDNQFIRGNKIQCIHKKYGDFIGSKHTYYLCTYVLSNVFVCTYSSYLLCC